MNTEGIELFVCRVDEPDGFRDYVTLVSPEVSFSRGLLPEAVVGVLSRLLQPDEQITSDVFTRNRVFIDFMHEVIARHAPNDPNFKAEARRQHDGWIYIVDRRNPDLRDAPSEDIIGSFHISTDDAVPGSYQRNPDHRILSSRGFFNLGLYLNRALMDEMLARY